MDPLDQVMSFTGSENGGRVTSLQRAPSVKVLSPSPS